MRKYIKQYKVKTSVAILTIILSSMISVLGAFFLAGMVNAATTRNVIILKNYFFGALIYLLVLALVGRIDNHLQNSLAKNINISLRNDIFSSIIKDDRNGFHKKSVGEYMSIITNDVDMIANTYVNAILTMTGTVVTIILVIVSIIYIDVTLLIFVIIIGLCYLLFTSQLSKSLSTYKDEWKKMLEQYTTKIKDLLSGYEVIRDFDLQDKAIEMFDKVSTHTGEKKKRLSIKVDNLNNINFIIGQAIVIMIVFVSSYLVTIKQMTVGELIALVQLIATIIVPLHEMTGCINELISSKNIKDELINKVYKLKNIDSTNKIENKLNIDKLGAGENNICMEDVCFTYDGVHKILNHVNIELKHGKKYAIIGESGTGKSSLIGLLMNYFENYQGRILFNGVDYRKIDTESLSKLFAVVHQNVILFDGTIRDNLTLFEDKNVEEVNKVIESACLDGVMEKKSLESILSENGSTLSGGEKQRISIARALLMKRKILVLDEAISSLDEETATKIMKNILKIQGQTCIAILHYLPEQVRGMFDCIFRLENGQLIIVDN